MKYNMKDFRGNRVELRVLEIGEYFVFPADPDELFRKTDFNINNDIYVPIMNSATGKCIARAGAHHVIRVVQDEPATFRMKFTY